MSAVGVSAASIRTGSGAGRLTRPATTFALWLAAGLLFGLGMAVTLPYLVGDRSLSVLSGSMEPALGVGDVVVVRQTSPLEARVGDVITFRDPADPTRFITHRVRSVEVSDGVVRFVTKGDANTSVENWKMSQEGSIGRVVYRVPKIGYVLGWIRGALGRMLLVVLPAILLGGYELWRIWRPTRDGEPAADGEDVPDAA